MKTKPKAKITSPSSAKTSKPSEPPSHASNESLIDVDNVTVKLGGQEVVKRASFCIHAGEFVGIIGPNGAGKTTLLRSLLGLIKPARGSIKLAPDTVVGYVPQSGFSHDASVPISVLEVVNLGAKGQRQVAERMLAEAGMAKFANRRMAELSGGQQQRVLIAKALAGKPDILFLDEPTTGIDEASQKDFYETVNRLHEDGLAIVMVSHDIDVVLQQVGRVICLNQTVRYDGAPDQFKIEEFLPSFYAAQHRILHHHHGGGKHV